MNYLNKKIKPLFREGLSLQLWKPHPNEEPYYDIPVLIVSQIISHFKIILETLNYDYLFFSLQLLPQML